MEDGTEGNEDDAQDNVSLISNEEAKLCRIIQEADQNGMFETEDDYKTYSTWKRKWMFLRAKTVSNHLKCLLPMLTKATGLVFDLEDTRVCRLDNTACAYFDIMTYFEPEIGESTFACSVNVDATSQNYTPTGHAELIYKHVVKCMSSCKPLLPDSATKDGFYQRVAVRINQCRSTLIEVTVGIPTCAESAASALMSVLIFHLKKYFLHADGKNSNLTSLAVELQYNDGSRKEIVFGKGKIFETVDSLRFYINSLNFSSWNPICMKELSNSILKLADVNQNWSIIQIGSLSPVPSLVLAKVCKSVFMLNDEDRDVGEYIYENAVLNGIENFYHHFGRMKKILEDVLQAHNNDICDNLCAVIFDSYFFGEFDADPVNSKLLKNCHNVKKIVCVSASRNANDVKKLVALCKEEKECKYFFTISKVVSVDISTVYRSNIQMVYLLEPVMVKKLVQEKKSTSVTRQKFSSKRKTTNSKIPHSNNDIKAEDVTSGIIALLCKAYRSRISKKRSRNNRLVALGRNVKHVEKLKGSKLQKLQKITQKWYNDGCNKENLAANSDVSVCTTSSLVKTLIKEESMLDSNEKVDYKNESEEEGHAECEDLDVTVIDIVEEGIQTEEFMIKKENCLTYLENMGINEEVANDYELEGQHIEEMKGIIVENLDDSVDVNLSFANDKCKEELQHIFECNEELQHISECKEELQHISESNEELQHISECKEELQHISESNEELQHISESNEELQHISECKEELQHISESNEELQHISECNEELQHIFECNEELQHLSECNEELQHISECNDSTINIERFVDIISEEDLINNVTFDEQKICNPIDNIDNNEFRNEFSESVKPTMYNDGEHDMLLTSKYVKNKTANASCEESSEETIKNCALEVIENNDEFDKSGIDCQRTGTFVGKIEHISNEESENVEGKHKSFNEAIPGDECVRCDKMDISEAELDIKCEVLSEEIDLDMVGLNTVECKEEKNTIVNEEAKIFANGRQENSDSIVGSVLSFENNETDRYASTETDKETNSQLLNVKMEESVVCKENSEENLNPDAILKITEYENTFNKETQLIDEKTENSENITETTVSPENHTYLSNMDIPNKQEQIITSSDFNRDGSRNDEKLIVELVDLDSSGTISGETKKEAKMCNKERPVDCEKTDKIELNKVDRMCECNGNDEERLFETLNLRIESNEKECLGEKEIVINISKNLCESVAKTGSDPNNFNRNNDKKFAKVEMDSERTINRPEYDNQLSVKLEAQHETDLYDEVSENLIEAVSESNADKRDREILNEHKTTTQGFLDLDSEDSTESAKSNKGEHSLTDDTSMTNCEKVDAENKEFPKLVLNSASEDLDNRQTDHAALPANENVNELIDSSENSNKMIDSGENVDKNITVNNNKLMCDEMIEHETTPNECEHVNIAVEGEQLQDNRHENAEGEEHQPSPILNEQDNDSEAENISSCIKDMVWNGGPHTIGQYLTQLRWKKDVLSSDAKEASVQLRPLLPYLFKFRTPEYVFHKDRLRPSFMEDTYCDRIEVFSDLNLETRTVVMVFGLSSDDADNFVPLRNINSTITSSLYERMMTFLEEFGDSFFLPKGRMGFWMGFSIRVNSLGRALLQAVIFLYGSKDDAMLTISDLEDVLKDYFTSDETRDFALDSLVVKLFYQFGTETKALFGKEYILENIGDMEILLYEPFLWSDVSGMEALSQAVLDISEINDSWAVVQIGSGFEVPSLYVAKMCEKLFVVGSSHTFAMHLAENARNNKIKNISLHTGSVLSKLRSVISSHVNSYSNVCLLMWELCDFQGNEDVTLIRNNSNIKKIIFISRLNSAIFIKKIALLCDESLKYENSTPFIMKEVISVDMSFKENNLKTVCLLVRKSLIDIDVERNVSFDKGKLRKFLGEKKRKVINEKRASVTKSPRDEIYAGKPQATVKLKNTPTGISKKLFHDVRKETHTSGVPTQSSADGHEATNEKNSVKTKNYENDKGVVETNNPTNNDVKQNEYEVDESTGTDNRITEVDNDGISYNRSAAIGNALNQSVIGINSSEICDLHEAIPSCKQSQDENIVEDQQNSELTVEAESCRTSHSVAADGTSTIKNDFPTGNNLSPKNTQIFSDVKHLSNRVKHMLPYFVKNCTPGLILHLESLKTCPVTETSFDVMEAHVDIQISNPNCQVAVVQFTDIHGSRVELIDIKSSISKSICERIASMVEKLPLCMPKSRKSVWKRFLVKSNSEGHSLLHIDVEFSDDIEDLAHEVAKVERRLSRYFLNDEFPKLGLSSLVLKTFHRGKSKVKVLHGTNYIPEIIGEFKIRVCESLPLLNPVGVMVLSKAILELVKLDDSWTVVQHGCEYDVPSLCLAQICQRIFVLNHTYAEIKRLSEVAKENDLQNFSFYSGNVANNIRKFIKNNLEKSDYKNICVLAYNVFPGNSRKEVGLLRTLSNVKAVVIVTQRYFCTESRKLLVSLCQRNYNTNPFVVSKAVPVEVLPNSKDTVMLYLLVRISSLPNLVKQNVDFSKEVLESYLLEAEVRQQANDEKPEAEVRNQTNDEKPSLKCKKRKRIEKCTDPSARIDKESNSDSNVRRKSMSDETSKGTSLYQNMINLLKNVNHKNNPYNMELLKSNTLDDIPCSDPDSNVRSPKRSRLSVDKKRSVSSSDLLEKILDDMEVRINTEKIETYDHAMEDRLTSHLHSNHRPVPSLVWDALEHDPGVKEARGNIARMMQQGGPNLLTQHEQQALWKRVCSLADAKLVSDVLRDVVQNVVTFRTPGLLFQLEDMRLCLIEETLSDRLEGKISLQTTAPTQHITNPVMECGRTNGSGSFVPVEWIRSDLTKYLVERLAAFVRESGYPLYNPVLDDDGFWKGFVIRVNNSGQSLLQIEVNYPQFPGDAFSNTIFLDLTDKLKAYFSPLSSQQGYDVISLILKVQHRSGYEVTSVLFGENFLCDVFENIKIKLYQPFLWSNPHGMLTLCHAIQELLDLSRTSTLLQLGCGYSVPSLYLAQLCEEIFLVSSVETLISRLISDAEENNITNIFSCVVSTSSLVNKLRDLFRSTLCRKNEISVLIFDYGEIQGNNDAYLLLQYHQVTRILYVARFVTPVLLRKLAALCSGVSNTHEPFVIVKVTSVEMCPDDDNVLMLFCLVRKSSLPQCVTEEKIISKQKYNKVMLMTTRRDIQDIISQFENNECGPPEATSPHDKIIKSASASIASTDMVSASSTSTGMVSASSTSTGIVSASSTSTGMVSDVNMKESGVALNNNDQKECKEYEKILKLKWDQVVSEAKRISSILRPVLPVLVSERSSGMVFLLENLRPCSATQTLSAVYEAWSYFDPLTKQLSMKCKEQYDRKTAPVKENKSDIIDNVNEIMTMFINTSEYKIFNTRSGSGFWKRYKIRVNHKGNVLLFIEGRAKNLSKAKILMSVLDTSLKKHFEGHSNIASLTVEINYKKNGKHTRVLIGNAFITETIGNFVIRIYPEHTSWVNPFGCQELSKTVLDLAAIDKTWVVLQIGFGTSISSLFLSEVCRKVFIVLLGGENTRNHDARSNGVENITFVYGRADLKVIEVLKRNEVCGEKVCVLLYDKCDFHSDVIFGLRKNSNVMKIILPYNFGDIDQIKAIYALCRDDQNQTEPFVIVKSVSVDMSPYENDVRIMFLLIRQSLHRDKYAANKEFSSAKILEFLQITTLPTYLPYSNEFCNASDAVNESNDAQSNLYLAQQDKFFSKLTNELSQSNAISKANIENNPTSILTCDVRQKHSLLNHPESCNHLQSLKRSYSFDEARNEALNETFQDEPDAKKLCQSIEDKSSASDIHAIGSESSTSFPDHGSNIPENLNKADSSYLKNVYPVFDIQGTVSENCKSSFQSIAENTASICAAGSTSLEKRDVNSGGLLNVDSKEDTSLNRELVSSSTPKKMEEYENLVKWKENRVLSHAELISSTLLRLIPSLVTFRSPRLAFLLESLKPCPVTDTSCETYKVYSGVGSVSGKLEMIFDAPVGGKVLSYVNIRSNHMKDIYNKVLLFILNSSHGLFNPETKEGFWQSVSLKMNHCGDMMIVTECYSNSTMADSAVRMSLLASQMERYFANENAVVNNTLKSLVLKINHLDDMEYIVLHGEEFLLCSVGNFNIKIYDGASYWSNPYAAEQLSDAVVELAGVNKAWGVLQLDSESDIPSMKLAMACKELLLVSDKGDSDQIVRNAKDNNITNIRAIPSSSVCDVLSKNLTDCEYICVLVSSSDSFNTNLHSVTQELIRNSKNVKKVLLILDTLDLSFVKTFVTLCQPCDAEDPFVIAGSIPVDMSLCNDDLRMVFLLVRKFLVSNYVEKNLLFSEEEVSKFLCIEAKEFVNSKGIESLKVISKHDAKEQESTDDKEEKEEDRNAALNSKTHSAVNEILDSKEKECSNITSNSKFCSDTDEVDHSQNSSNLIDTVIPKEFMCRNSTENAANSSTLQPHCEGQNTDSGKCSSEQDSKKTSKIITSLMNSGIPKKFLFKHSTESATNSLQQSSYEEQSTDPRNCSIQQESCKEVDTLFKSITSAVYSNYQNTKQHFDHVLKLKEMWISSQIKHLSDSLVDVLPYYVAFRSVNLIFHQEIMLTYSDTDQSCERFEVTSGYDSEMKRVMMKYHECPNGSLVPINCMPSSIIEHVLDRMKNLIEKSKYGIFDRRKKSGVWKSVVLAINGAGQIMLVIKVVSASYRSKKFVDILRSELQQYFLYRTFREFNLCCLLLEVQWRRNSEHIVVLGEESLTYNVDRWVINIYADSYPWANTSGIINFSTAILDLADVDKSWAAVQIGCDCPLVSLSLANVTSELYILDKLPCHGRNVMSSAKANNLQNLHYVHDVEIIKSLNDVLSVNLRTHKRVCAVVFDIPNCKDSMMDLMLTLRNNSKVKKLIFISQFFDDSTTKELFILCCDNSAWTEPFLIVKAAPVDMSPYEDNVTTVFLLIRKSQIKSEVVINREFSAIKAKNLLSVISIPKQQTQFSNGSFHKTKLNSPRRRHENKYLNSKYESRRYPLDNSLASSIFNYREKIYRGVEANTTYQNIFSSIYLRNYGFPDKDIDSYEQQSLLQARDAEICEMQLSEEFRDMCEGLGRYLKFQRNNWTPDTRIYNPYGYYSEAQRTDAAYHLFSYRNTNGDTSSEYPSTAYGDSCMSRRQGVGLSFEDCYSLNKRLYPDTSRSPGNRGPGYKSDHSRFTYRHRTTTVQYSGNGEIITNLDRTQNHKRRGADTEDGICSIPKQVRTRYKQL